MAVVAAQRGCQAHGSSTVILGLRPRLVPRRTWCCKSCCSAPPPRCTHTSPSRASCSPRCRSGGTSCWAPGACAHEPSALPHWRRRLSPAAGPPPPLHPQRPHPAPHPAPRPPCSRRDWRGKGASPEAGRSKHTLCPRNSCAGTHGGRAGRAERVAAALAASGRAGEHRGLRGEGTWLRTPRLLACTPATHVHAEHLTRISTCATCQGDLVRRARSRGLKASAAPSPARPAPAAAAGGGRGHTQERGANAGSDKERELVSRRVRLGAERTTKCVLA